MLTIDLVLEIVACVCFVCAMFGVTARVNLIAAGLALWMLALILP